MESLPTLGTSLEREKTETRPQSQPARMGLAWARRYGLRELRDWRVWESGWWWGFWVVVGFEGRKEGSLVKLRGLREDLVGGRRRSLGLGLGLRNARGGGGGFRRIRNMFLFLVFQRMSERERKKMTIFRGKT